MDYCVGIDVGATKVLIGLVGDDGSVVFSKNYLLDKTSQEAVLHMLLRSIDDFMSLIDKKVVFIGAGIVGHIDSRKGVWINSMNIPIQTPVHIVEMIEKKYKTPSKIDNDVHCATIAELVYGAGKDSHDFIYINVGTGISAGMVCNGRLVRGADNYAGEFGHTSVSMDGLTCSCGRIGCVEASASGGGIAAQKGSYPLFTHHISQNLDSKKIFELARSGDLSATDIIHNATKALGSGITNLINLLNPEEILLGGSVAKNEHDYVNMLWDYIRANALPSSLSSLRYFGVSKLDVGTIGVLGAASLWKV